jgi:hypothetical protein
MKQGQQKLSATLSLSDEIRVRKLLLRLGPKKILLKGKKFYFP